MKQPNAFPAAVDRLACDELRDALREAHLPTLLLVLHQLTGEERWLSEHYAPTRARGMEDHDSAGLPDDLQAEVRAAALDAIIALGDAPLPAPATDELPALLSFALHDEVPAEYAELLAEEFGTLPRSVGLHADPVAAGIDVLVIGAGMAGINIAIELARAGMPFKVIEKNQAVGGTWLENHYPGCGVDTPSHLYSFSFAQRSDWRKYYAARDQLADYFKDLADEFDLLDHIDFGTKVMSAAWSELEARWAVTLLDAAGVERRLRPRVLISAVGHFNAPKIPGITGLDSFPGPAMHTARWDDSVDVAGKRVAVIGTGASSMQIVPAMAGTASRVTVFQGSRQWVIPSPNHGREISPAVRYLLENVPFYGQWYRLWNFWRFGDRVHPALRIDPDYPEAELGLAVSEINARHRRALERYASDELGGDQRLLDLCIPDYPPYARRPLFDHGWYRTISRDDVELVEGRVVEVRGSTLITADGRGFEADVLALATGFQTLDLLGSFELVGRSGRTLRQAWGDEDAQAYLGITVADFPNFFILFGPNTNTGHGGSAFLTNEMQVRYTMKLIGQMVDQGLVSVECRQDAFDRYAAEVDAALEATVYSHPKAHGYYRNKNGRIIGSSPWEYIEYWRRTRTPDLADYDVRS
jgi:4-hydroxyacetophenone monooxygenase